MASSRCQGRQGLITERHSELYSLLESCLLDSQTELLRSLTDFESFLRRMTTYYYAVASQRFLLEEEPLAEVLKERHRHYQEQEKEIDFWLIKNPAFLEAPDLEAVKAACPQPSAAIVSTDKVFITWLKLRLEYVATGEFKAPLAGVSDPLASLAAA